jgi:hypothetical protein
MQKFVRRWIPHDSGEANRRECVLKINLLLEELRADEGNEFANTMTGDESWFYLVTNRIPCLQRSHSIVDQVTFEDLQWVFHNWMEKLNCVVGHNGDYFQE